MPKWQPARKPLDNTTIEEETELEIYIDLSQ